MTTQVRFGVSGESLLNSGDDEFLAAVEWRGDGLKQLAGKAGDSDLSLRTIGLCWKQQAADRTLPKLSGPVAFSSLNGSLASSEAGSLLAVLRDVRKATRKSNSGSLPSGWSLNLIVGSRTGCRLSSVRNRCWHVSSCW